MYRISGYNPKKIPHTNELSLDTSVSENSMQVTIYKRETNSISKGLSLPRLFSFVDARHKQLAVL